MEIVLRIEPGLTQIDQIANLMQVPIRDNTLEIPSFIGTGAIRYFPLPYGIQVHHYTYQIKEPVSIRSENPVEGGMYMLQINLSNAFIEKSVGDQALRLSQQGRTGALFYSPGFPSIGSAETEQAYSIVIISLPVPFVEEHFSIEGTSAPFCQYEELSDLSDLELNNILLANLNPMQRQVRLLAWIAALVEQFAYRAEGNSFSEMNPADVARLFKVKEILEQALFGQLPTLAQIAQTVLVSQSKLKADFKAVFGQSIYQYYLYRKMLEAQRLLKQDGNNISEVGLQLGYTNLSQFTAQFKKQTGQTPSAFQKAAKR
ncbi:MAG: AraC family transcriptional regulator [Bacteroidota bacterium]